MRRILFVLTLIGCQRYAEAQKPILDSGVFDKWPYLDDPKISSNGNFVMYLTINQPVSSRTLTVQSTQSDWRRELPGVPSAEFSPDSRWISFVSNDSLRLQALGKDVTVYFPNVASYKFLPKGEWVAIQKNDAEKKLVLRNLTTGIEHSYPNVVNYVIGNKGDMVIITTKTSGNSQTTEEIEVITITKENNSKVLWTGTHTSSLILDNEDNQIAFIERRGNNDGNRLWNCIISENKCSLLTDDSLQGIETGFQLARILKYSNDREAVFLSLARPEGQQPKGKIADLEVWNYKDFKLQSQQVADLNPSNTLRPQPHYTTAVSIRDKKIIRLEDGNDRIISPLFSRKFADDFLLMVHNRGDVMNEWNWNPEAQSSVILVSTKTGDRKVLNSGLAEPIFSSYRLSPGGKYVIYYDPKNRNYFSYSTSSGALVNLTKNIAGRWTTFERNDEPDSAYLPFRLGGWSQNDSSAFIYDQNDIFLVDPSGKRASVSLTNGYGRRNNLVFRLAGYYFDEWVPADGKLILSAFDRLNKNDGFYSVNPWQSSDPQVLTMGPYIYTGPDESLEIIASSPIKAENNGSYIVRRMTASESPNFLYTRDFKNFKPLSRLYPERNYNWLTSELINFPTRDGKSSMGILYKPEDFDPSKKYPIIFCYYERFSDALHNYILPNACIGPINVPFFVSSGYLIFIPDIHYTIGFPGRSAFHTVTSAASYLSKFRWVDTSKMGIWGHSFGGFETNYIITRTSIFTAAMSASGMADFISAYGSIIGNGTSRQGQYEIHRDRIGFTLWERPDLYVENSPVLKADKVNTPVLMMNNRHDSDVPFAQGVELFTALRRLGKKVWMLQYNGEDHTVSGNAAKDLTERACQFFDHFLKGMPPPKWMTEGMPASMKERANGLELDLSDRLP